MTENKTVCLLSTKSIAYPVPKIKQNVKIRFFLVVLLCDILLNQKEKLSFFERG